MSPLLLVVTGLPAAGKTTLATALAQELRWPLVTKDDYKAILLAGLNDDLKPQFSKKVGKLSFDLMWHVAGVTLAAGVDTILETHFYLGVSDPVILALAETHGARLAQIHCHAPLPELERRHAARVAAGTRPGIDLPFKHEDLPAHCNWEPLNLGPHTPLLRLDTTAPEYLAEALTWLKMQLA